MRRHAVLAAIVFSAALAACRHGAEQRPQSQMPRRVAPVARAPDRDASPSAKREEEGAHRAREGAPRARFEVRGTVASAGGGLFGGNRLKIDRPGEPQAELRVEDGTRITIGGQPAKLSDLAEGDEVRATFDMDGDRAVATSIRAERTASRHGGK